MVDSKQLKQLCVGALVNGVADGAVETYYNNNASALMNKFPFIRPIEVLPPVDDWFFVGVPAATYLIAKKKGKENIKNASLGALLYGGAMFVHHTIIAVNSFLNKPKASVSQPIVTAATPTISRQEPKKDYLLI